MDKREFLSRLERALSILQEDELRDIISEYEQHIDMKVEKGLTEEEAIADFGSFEELTGEILEAYHVRADYAAGSRRVKEKADKGQGEQSLAVIGKLREAGKDFPAKEMLRRMGGKLQKSGLWLWHQFCRPFLWAGRVWKKQSGRRSLIQGREGERKMTKEVKEGTGISGLMAGMGEEIKRLFEFLRKVIIWGVRMIWNGCWGLFSLFAVVFGLFSLYGLGILAILLMQGYPLTGVLVGCLGLVMCAFSAAGLGVSFMWRKKTAGRRKAGNNWIREEGALAEEREEG